MSGICDTEREIASQPDIWERWADELPAIARDIREWIAARQRREIWLSGAGSSAFIADTLAVSLDASVPGIRFRGVASTDLVATPNQFMPAASNNVLVVSFGRSGNSSETIGTLDTLDRDAPSADRLHITCNAQSALAQRNHPGPGEQRIIVLPDACHDAGFAMTSSFTTMLLTALACLGSTPHDTCSQSLYSLAAEARRCLAMPLDYPISERAVFLGSGPLQGAARESALKVLELSAGRVVTAWDTNLGFRHGPKAIVDERTAVFIYLSSDALTRRYDDDVADEIRTQFPHTKVVTLGMHLEGHAAPDIAFSGVDGGDAWNAALYVLMAQRLSVRWSKALGLNVDNPFSDGNLTRVVTNVRLYA